MKKTSTILAILLVLLAFTSCHKDKEFGSEKPEIGEVEVMPSLNHADFTWKVEYPGKFQTGVEIGDNKDLVDSRIVEGTKDGEVFKASVDQLEASTKYYYRIVVWNKVSRREGEVKSFTTPTFAISVAAKPVEGGLVEGAGGYNYNDECTLKAKPNEGYDFVNWTKDDGTEVSTDATYRFTVTESATYVAHFQIQSYSIEVSANLEEGGTVSGGGTFNYGENCTLTATANAGYYFDYWTKDGITINGDATISFTVTANSSYVAHFTIQTYTITTQSSPSNGGSESGGGNYTYGLSCTVMAAANSGYTFSRWTENGSQVSTDASYSFVVTSNRTLVANYYPVGAINGLFTIDAYGDQVFFSQGNLQYIGSASTPYWKFADNQWDVVGTTTDQNSTNQNVDRDLFGWGTSGYNHGAVCYQPWSTSQTNSDYYVYGQNNYNLYNQTGQADWGYNAISNGGNTTNKWRTLTGGYNGEWKYVFDIRSASTVNGVANARYAKAKVADVYGMILFPDIYLHPDGVAQPMGINQSDNTGWNGNDYSATDFLLMQNAGAVFLPAAGHRNGTLLYDVGSIGYYWSASYYYHDNKSASYVYFDHGILNPSYSADHPMPCLRYIGQSVRLVTPAE